MKTCSICVHEGDKEEIKHLPLYANGSEGIEACLQCRITLTEMIRGMMRVNIKGMKRGYKACRQIREAKEKQNQPATTEPKRRGTWLAADERIVKSA